MFSHSPGGNTDFYLYEIDNSCRFNPSDNTALTRTISASPTDSKKATFSTWIKLCTEATYQYLLGQYTGSNDRGAIRLNSSDQLTVFETASSVDKGNRTSVPIYRDASSWYHFMVVIDTTEASEGDRIVFYVNGVEIDKSVTISVDLNWEYVFLSASENILIGTRSTGTPLEEFDGYLSETHLIDGQALAPSSFGRSKNGVWMPKAYTGTYGNDGFYLDYSNSSHFGEDQSGNGNDWTDTGFDTADQMQDTPTNNWCTMNPLPYSNPKALFSDGNLYLTTNATTDGQAVYSTFTLPLTGKWYWEVRVSAIASPNADSTFVGIRDRYDKMPVYLYEPTSGRYYDNGSWAAYGDSWTTNDNIGIAYNADDNEITFYKNNVSQGVKSISGGYPTNAYLRMRTASGTQEFQMIFGQKNGTIYTPPTGFKYLNSINLPDLNSKYIEGNRGFDAALYTGTGAAKSITGLKFQPDLVWIKARDIAYGHHLQDSIRGLTHILNSNSVIAEWHRSDHLTSFDSDGFSIGAASLINASGNTFVSWCWKDDSSYGFDIVYYTGTGSAHTEAHSLGAVPEMMIVKNRDQNDAWWVYHKDNTANPETDYLVLDTDASTTDDITSWNDTAPTSSVFTVGTAHNVNASSENYIAYLFASIEGFSKIFSYTGNGNADGPFVYTGFRPRYIMIKNISNVGSWILQDTERTSNNQIDDYLKADTADVEDTVGENEIDFLSNGFKIRNTDSTQNTDTDVYIGIAFAETPFKYANAR